MGKDYNYDFCEWHADDKLNDMDIQTLETKFEMLKNNMWKYVRDLVIAIYKGKDNNKLNSYLNRSIGMLLVIGIIIMGIFTGFPTIAELISLFCFYEAIKLIGFVFTSITVSYPMTMRAYRRAIEHKEREKANEYEDRSLDRLAIFLQEHPCTIETLQSDEIKKQSVELNKNSDDLVPVSEPPLTLKRELNKEED